MAILPSGTTTIGQFLNRHELEEEVRLQAPALGVAVTLVVLHLCQRVGHLSTEIPLVGYNILILIEATLIIIGRQQRSHGQQVADAVTIDTANGYTFLVSRRESNVLTHFQDVATLFLDKGIVGVQTNGIAIELRIGRITDSTRLMILTKSKREARYIATTRNVDRRIMHRCIVDGGLFEPVGTIPGTIHYLGILLRNQFLPVVGSHALNLVGLVVDFHILLCVQGRYVVGVRVLPTHITIK